MADTQAVFVYIINHDLHWGMYVNTLFVEGDEGFFRTVENQA